jgi:vacuolar-type H+-ATPase catalytic subunit A/Vma1
MVLITNACIDPENGFFIVSNIVGFQVYVGGTNVAGEVISIHERFATIQMFGEATGFAVGDSVICTGRPLSVELGPGLLDSFFDGLQRQFERPDHDVHMPKLSGINALNKTKQWRFEPLSLSVRVVALDVSVW